MVFTRPCRQCGHSVESAEERCPFCGVPWPGEMSPDRPMLSAVLHRRDRIGTAVRILSRAAALGAAAVVLGGVALSLSGAL